MALVLTRRRQESVVITVGNVRVTVAVARLKGNAVELAFGAPPDVTIHRAEIQDQIDAEARRAEGETRGKRNG